MSEWFKVSYMLMLFKEILPECQKWNLRLVLLCPCLALNIFVISDSTLVSNMKLIWKYVSFYRAY